MRAVSTPNRPAKKTPVKKRTKTAPAVCASPDVEREQLLWQRPPSDAVGLMEAIERTRGAEAFTGRGGCLTRARQQLMAGQIGSVGALADQLETALTAASSSAALAAKAARLQALLQRHMFRLPRKQLRRRARCVSAVEGLVEAETQCCTWAPLGSDVTLACACASARGSFRKVNQDRYVLETRFPGMLFFGVFDGHGRLGEVAAALCAHQLPCRTALHIFAGEHPQVALRLAFKEMQEHLLFVAKQEEEMLGETLDYGTTAVFACLKDGVLFIANVGDSLAVLFQQTHVPLVVALTEPHTLESEDSEEGKRVVAEGGALHFTGSEFRVHPSSLPFKTAVQKRVTLNMTRALGHRHLSSAGVGSQPDVKSWKVTELLNGDSQCDIVLASDGVWDVLEFEEVQTALRNQRARDGLLRSVGDVLKRSEKRWNEAGWGDNATAVVVRVCTA